MILRAVLCAAASPSGGAQLMVITPNPAHTPAGGVSEQNPAVVNVRWPASVRPAALPDTEPLLAAGDESAALPPTVMRLAHLAYSASGTRGRVTRATSIAHWVCLVLGGLLALWLIFGGRGQPPKAANAAAGAASDREDFKSDWKAPPLPSAGSSQAPAWNPPPLPSAGESVAPAWTPPAPITVSPEPMPSTTPPAPDLQPAPEHEAWPQEKSQLEPQEPPYTEAAHGGPALRTAQREPYADAQPVEYGDDAQSLGITVAVPQ